MAIYLYLGCCDCRVRVPLSRSGSSGNGPLAGNENMYKFLDDHEFCPLVEVISDSTSMFDTYCDFVPIKEAPAGEDRGQGGKTKETTTKNESSV